MTHRQVDLHLQGGYCTALLQADIITRITALIFGAPGHYLIGRQGSIELHPARVLVALLYHMFCLDFLSRSRLIIIDIVASEACTSEHLHHQVH